MKTLYLECNMGAAGDMLMAALLELIPDREEFLREMNALGLPGVRVALEPAVKCGVTGSHISVTVHGAEEESLDVGAPHLHEHIHSHEHPHGHSHEEGHTHPHDHEGEHSHEHPHSHSHSGLGEIRHWISHLPVSDKVKADALAVYTLIAEAEGHAHGKPMEEIHFHEVGTLDAVADVVGVCLLMERIAPQQVVVSPVHVGSGQVHCAHGILPVPAPATAYILRDVPIYGGSIRGELCTPTGAALLKHFANSFGEMPVMRVEATGYGMGTKDFEAANCVRAHLGYTSSQAGEIAELCCNLDDMTPEAIGFAQEVLLDAGALDVFTTPIGMKKSRPGVLLTCLCRLGDREKLAKLMLRHTTTLGVREHLCRRYTLEREETVVETGCGPVRVKRAYGDGVERSKPEYEDIARIAREKGLPFDQARELVK